MLWITTSRKSDLAFIYSERHLKNSQGKEPNTVERQAEWELVGEKNETRIQRSEFNSVLTFVVWLAKNLNLGTFCNFKILIIFVLNYTKITLSSFSDCFIRRNRSITRTTLASSSHRRHRYVACTRFCFSLFFHDICLKWFKLKFFFWDLLCE